jgi:hypothetical protein
MDSGERNITRRRFLESGVGTAIGLAPVSGVLGAGSIGAQAGRKPGLTGSTITARIPSPERSQERKQMANAVKEDLVTYVRENFEVTELQLKQLQSLSPESRQTLNAAVDKAISERLKINVKGGCQQPTRGARESVMKRGEGRLTVKTQFTPAELVINFENGA